MLKASPVSNINDFDREAFALVVPADHYLRQVAAVIDFEAFRPRLETAYDRTMGRPPIDVVRMLRFMFLRFHYKLSDRQVMKRAETDLAFRWFLDLSLGERLPNHTNGTHFRHRIGVERFDQVFQELITQARDHSLINDRLRLKDATHMFASAADLRPLALAAQVRDHLLNAAEPFFSNWVREQRTAVEASRQATAELKDDERLARRVEFLQTLTTALQTRTATLPPQTEADAKRRQRLERALAVATHLLADQADPQTGDRLTSADDPDARRGKHGRQFFMGYLVDLTMDPDSELITAINVLPANGAEAADAIELVHKEEAAQGNDIEGLSMDGAGYNGPVLRALTDSDGLNLEVTVPLPQVSQRKTFGPERFSLTVLENDVGELTCPAGKSTRQRQRNEKDTGFKYIFKASQCSACAQRLECLEKPAGKTGRTVHKNDYEVEYRRLQEKAATPVYQQTRRMHPKVERKLGELARHHDLRHAKYRGQAKVLVQALLTGLVVNIKRLVHLFSTKAQESNSVSEVRAELASL